METRRLFALPLAAALAMALAGQAKPCIAYRKNGELRANCNGKDVLLLKRRGLASFAIGVGGGTVLTGVDWAYLVRNGAWTKLPAVPNTWTEDTNIRCGTAIAPQGNVALMQQVAVDIISGKPANFSFTSLKWPQCSADRTLIIGLNKAGALLTNRRRILDRKNRFGQAFAASPSGQWIAFIRGRGLAQLCISDTRNWSTRCFSKDAQGREGEFDFDQGATGGGVSVDNAGVVLLDEGYGETCWASSHGLRVSRRKFPGATAGECTGVGIAGPTLAPRVVIPLGSQPSWVDKKLLQAQFGTFK